MKLSVLSAAVVMVGGTLIRAGEVAVYPAPREAVPSRVYGVVANGQAVFTESFKDIHCASFSASGEVVVKVKGSAPIRTFSISPKSSPIAGAVKGDTLTFTVVPSRQLVITINDGPRLVVMANLIDAAAPLPRRLGVTDIRDLGVDPTGDRLETARIQRAIDGAAARGGVLYFPPGTYLTGTLVLKSNLTLYLAGGAVLLGSTDRNDYPVDPEFKESDAVNDPANYSNQGAKMTYSRLLLVDHAKNVRIAGDGIIDGRGRIVRDQGKPANLLRIRDSSNVTVEGVTLRDPAAWNTHVLYSDHVTFRDVKIVNDRGVKNTDGIDPDSSQDVLLDRCFFYCGDDAIAIKTSGNSGLVRNAERITVRGCVMLTKKSAMKLGTESFAEHMRDVTFEDNDVVEADRAMSLYCADGSKYEHIRWLHNRIENVYPDAQRRTLHFTVIKRGGREAGSIRDVLIQDTDVAAPSPNPLVMEGYDAAHGISGVRLVNFSVGGRLCRSAEDARLETNRFVEGVTFTVE